MDHLHYHEVGIEYRGQPRRLSHGLYLSMPSPQTQVCTETVEGMMDSWNRQTLTSSELAEIRRPTFAGGQAPS